MPGECDPINLDAFTAPAIRRTNSENYEEMLGRVFPTGRCEELPNGMRVWAGGGPRKLCFMLGFQSGILNATLLIDRVLKRLGPEYGYLTFDWPGVGQNRNVAPNSAASIPDVLYRTTAEILRHYEVTALVPTSLANRLVFCRLRELAQIQPELRVAFVVPAILPGPQDDWLCHYFSLFSMLHTRLGIRAYRSVNGFAPVRWIWNRIVCPGAREPRVVPLQDLGKRLSVTPWTPNHFISMHKQCVPTESNIPDTVKCVFVLAKSDGLAQPHAHEKWLAGGNLPPGAIHWVESNHIVEMNVPDEVAEIIEQLVHS